ncbi:MAG TPA: division/cell wall cluster transcriptional repressor MraZ [Bacillota bacterium]|nr:division/cell wall cluster transcriptional repressor MraZ [Bacillota bacterium]
MFRGQYQHTLDEKGRIIIPAKFRERLGDTFIMTQGFEQCLFIYPMSEWEILERQLMELPTTQKEERDFLRLLGSSAVEIDTDKQGRVVIPAHLREYAQVHKDVYTIGVFTKIELWSKESWQQYSERIKGSFEEMAKNTGLKM